MPGFSPREPATDDSLLQQLISDLTRRRVPVRQIRELFCVMLLREWANERRAALDLNPTGREKDTESTDLPTTLFSRLDPMRWDLQEPMKSYLKKLGEDLSHAAATSDSRHADALEVLGEAVSRTADLMGFEPDYFAYSLEYLLDEKPTPAQLLRLFEDACAELGKRGKQFFVPQNWAYKLVRDISMPGSRTETVDASRSSTELFLARVAEHAASVAISREGKERDLPYDPRRNNHEFLVGLTRHVLSERIVEADPGLATQPFDFMLANPPFGNTVARAIRERSGGEAASVSLPEAFFLDRILKALRPGGHAAIIVPAGFLTRESAAQLRHRLIEKRILETVILLPPRVFPNAPKVRAAILKLVYQGAAKTIQIIDASTLDGRSDLSFRIEKNSEPPLTTHLFYCRAGNASQGVPCDSEFLDPKQLAANGWKIEIHRRDLQRPSWVDTELGTVLGEQQCIVTFERHARLHVGLYVKSKYLESGAPPTEAIGYLRISDYEDGEVHEPELWFLPDKVSGVCERLLKAGDVLMSRSGTIAKAVVFSKLALPAIACGGIYVIEVDPSTLDRDFLVGYIHSASCQQLLNMRAKRSVVSNLRKENVLSLDMPLPPLDLQKRVAAEARRTGEDLLACLAKALGTSLRPTNAGD